MTDMISLDRKTLARFMPMHFTVDENGIITGVGETLAKLLEDDDMIGQKMLDLFSFRRPQGIDTFEHIKRGLHRKIVLTSVNGVSRRLPGLIAHMGAGQGYLVNLSLGASFFRIFNEGRMHSKDFAPTDQSIDMMYMVEMQQALLAASRGLNNQLNGAKMIAEEQALSDPLTGLNNRRSLRQYLQHLIDTKTDTPFAVVLIDLDFFKSVNDSLGHAAGDFVLKSVAEKLLASTRPTDMVARVGGDDFVLVLPDFGDASALRSFAKRIIELLSEKSDYAGKPCQIGASIGAVMTDGSGWDTVEQILIKSDDALYMSKKAGRGCVTLSDNGRILLH